MKSDYTGLFCISYPIQCVLQYNLSDSDLLNKIDSRNELVLFKNLRSVGPRKLKPPKSTNHKKITQKNKKFRSVNMQLPTAPMSVKINILNVIN